jgi:hypothetical protein
MFNSKLLRACLTVAVWAACPWASADAGKATGGAGGAPPTADAAAGAAILSVDQIWDRAPHNAFTDLIRTDGQWVCAFREAPAHTGGVKGSVMRVLTSADGRRWESAAELSDPRGDIRDAKMAVMPDGRLMLLTAIQLFEARDGQKHLSQVWLTRDMKNWDGPHDVADLGMWLWGIRWHKGTGYSIGYATGKERFVRLYKTTDGVKFDTVVDRLEVTARYPNESAIVFDAADTAYALLRCDPDPAYVGTAKPPYTQWTWKQSATRVGGPALTLTPDGRLLGAGRLHDGKVRTSLFWVDPLSAKIEECLTLPSGGDTSYPGLVWDGPERLVMSYYSTHQEGKSKIYLANVRVPATASKIRKAD